MFPVAILAGGLATRLRPMTSTIPKSMVMVAGRPFIAWQLDYLRQQGIIDVIICAGYLGEQIEDFIGNGGAYGLKVAYSYDGPELLGTGGALKQALPLLGNAFFVFYGDSYLPINFLDVALDFQRQGKPALMTVIKNNNQWDKSNVLFENDLLIEYNKHHPKPDMAYIDYGLGLISSAVLLDHVGNKPFDLADVYGQLSTKGHLAGYEVFERFYEVGSHAGLKDAAGYLEGQKINRAGVV